MKKLYSAFLISFLFFNSYSQIDTYFEHTSCDTLNSSSYSIFIFNGQGPYYFTFALGDGYIRYDTLQDLNNPFGNLAFQNTHVYPVAGNYMVELSVIDSLGNVDSFSQLVDIRERGVLLNGQAPSCFNVCDGLVEVEILGSTGNSTIYWNSDTLIFTDTTTLSGFCPSTEYFVTQDAECSWWQPVDLNKPEHIFYRIELVYPSCSGSDGSISFLDSSLIPVSIVWGPGGGTDTILDSLAGGTYFLEITDTTGCSVYDTINLTDSCGVVTGNVYQEIIGNSIYDSLDLPLAGVMLELRQSGFATVSDINGYYELILPSLAVDTFQVDVTTPLFTNYCAGLFLEPGIFTNPVSGMFDVIVDTFNPSSYGNDVGIAQPGGVLCGWISGTLFTDWNQNGIQDTSEGGFYDGRMKISGQYTTYTNSILDGSYSVEVPVDITYDISFRKIGAPFYCPNSSALIQTFPLANAGYTVTLDSNNLSSDGNDFGVDIDSSFIYDVGVYSIRTYHNLNAGHIMDFYMDYKAMGEITDNCTLRLNFDHIFTFVGASTPPTNIGSTYIEWVFTPPALAAGCMLMEFYLDSSAVAGSSYEFMANFNCGGQNDACPDNDTIVRQHTVSSGPAKVDIDLPTNALFSYIPKGEMPDIIDEARDFSYVVNFQNTTGHTVYNLMIVDTLPEHFQIESVSRPFSNYPYQLTLTEEGVMFLQFDGIQIPDSSVDAQKSTGFIQFNVRAKPNLPDGTEFRNRAWLSFNRSALIPTNEVVNTLKYPLTGVEPLSVDGVISVYPNPNSGSMLIDMSSWTDPSAEISIIDQLGKTVFTKKWDGYPTMNVELNVSSGVYLLQVSSKDLSATKVVVIE